MWYIMAMVGGRGDDAFNRATQAERQPGSANETIWYTWQLFSLVKLLVLSRREPLLHLVTRSPKKTMKMTS